MNYDIVVQGPNGLNRVLRDAPAFQPQRPLFGARALGSGNAPAAGGLRGFFSQFNQPGGASEQTAGTASESIAAPAPVENVAAPAPSDDSVASPLDIVASAHENVAVANENVALGFGALPNLSNLVPNIPSTGSLGNLLAPFRAKFAPVVAPTPAPGILQVFRNTKVNALTGALAPFKSIFTR